MWMHNSVVVTENVLAPYSIELILSKLKKPYMFYSVSIYALNKGSAKLFPIALRYFAPTQAIQTGVLYFYSDHDETTVLISETIT